MRFAKKLKESQEGFTLIEILVVLVILAIMAAISIPSMTGFIDDARKMSATAEARVFMWLPRLQEQKAMQKKQLLII